MKLTSLAMPSIALGAVALFILPEQSEGYSLLGGSLGTGQRDVRIYNNFSDASDNNNQTPNADFPGYFGAEMALWKACQEWTSEQYGANFTDPAQQYLGGDVNGTMLGNFDISWQGKANGIGNTNSNIHSQIAGSNGGVLAYTETHISDGWRIRYYEGWNWADGPGASVSGVDLQGVGCHEYGHALGLGHTGVNGATMYPSISGSGVAARSINFDDKNGLKAVYGAASASKPHLDAFSVNGTSITVTGTDFSATNNEVWFTQFSTGGNGTPVKMLGIASNGTSMTFTIPANAGPGMIISKTSGSGHSSLSNSIPYDGSGSSGTGPIGDIYCMSNPNSTFQLAELAAEGSLDVSDNDVNFEVTLLPANQFGYFLLSDSQSNVPNFGGSSGVLCLGSPLVRFAGNVLNSGATGEVMFSPDLTNLPGGIVINPGETWNWQMWYRDGATSNTTGGMEITFQ
jgi:hypothetical protein